MSYREFNKDEMAIVNRSIEGRKLSKGAGASLIMLYEARAKFENRPAMDIFIETERDRLSGDAMEEENVNYVDINGTRITSDEYLQALTKDDDFVTEFFLNLRSEDQTTRVLSSYELLYGEEPLEHAGLRKERILFHNSQEFRNKWLAKRGFPEGLNNEEAKELLFLDGKSRGLL